MLKIPFYLKPSIGGLFTGCIEILTPMAIGNGYGWLQLIMDGKIADLKEVFLGILGIIFGVSFTLGSGGSGGIFGHSVMIGGLTGAFYALFLNQHTSLNLPISSFMIVGMVSLFGSAAKAPISTLLLIAEMTGGYSLLFPGMLSVFISYYLSGKKSVFPSQLESRLDSPAYKKELGIFILEKLKVKDFMKNPITIQSKSTLSEAKTLMQKHLISGLPVLNGEKLVGIITKTDLSEVPKNEWNIKKVEEVMTKNIISIDKEATLSQALEIMINEGIGRLVVTDKEGNLIGIISRADIGKALRETKK